jgi:hypothetical protein
MIERTYRVTANVPAPHRYGYRLIGLENLEDDGTPTGEQTDMTTIDGDVIDVCKVGNKIKLTWEDVAS